MADRIYLSNDTAQGGIFYDEDVFFFNALANETSAHGASAATVQVAGPMKANGKIYDFVIGVVNPALSASGFVSGSVSAQVRINSASVCTTVPSIVVATVSGAVTRKATNQNVSGVTPAVLGATAALFSAGDMISIDYQAQSGGSAAAGAAGKGLYGMIRVRYNAV